jgi:hypothetical protein
VTPQLKFIKLLSPSIKKEKREEEGRSKKKHKMEKGKKIKTMTIEQSRNVRVKK